MWLPEGWRPAPPGKLFGLWVLTADGGYWLNHTSSRSEFSSPMTFESWDDAFHAAEEHRGHGEAIVVAVIGVAPSDEVETAALSALID